MNASTRNIIVDLIVSNHGSPGRPIIPTRKDRLELQRHLTHVAVNDATLARHKTVLNTMGNEHPSLPVDIVWATVNTGLDALDNVTLATLALDPIALDLLYQEIQQKNPEAWQPAIHAEGITLNEYAEVEEDAD